MACVVGCVYGVYPLGYSVLWRGLSVGYGVHVWWVGGLVALGVRCAGVLWRVWVRCYGVCMALAYGVRMVALGMRVYGVVCTCCDRRL